jgi:hypothetical protein
MGDDVEGFPCAAHDDLQVVLPATDAGEIRPQHRAVGAGRANRRGARVHDALDVLLGVARPELARVGLIPQAIAGF